MQMRIPAVVAAACMVIAAPSLAQKPYAGTATGNLNVDGKPIPLKYAYAIEVDNVEAAGLLMAGTRKSLVIVLSDRALPLSSVSDRDAPYSDRRSPAQILAPVSKTVADKIRGIVLKIDPAKANPLGAQLLFPGNDGIDFSIVGTEYPDRIIGLKRAGGFLSGTAVLPALQQTHLEKGPKKYQYKATFRAPIVMEEPVTENLVGQAALNSAPVAVLKSYVEAGKRADVEGLRKLTASTHTSYLSNKEFIESLKSAEVEKLPEQVKRVVVRGDQATVVIVSEQPSYSQVMMRLVREKGDWKLCWP
jgi:hypothetical protein